MHNSLAKQTTYIRKTNYNLNEETRVKPMIIALI